MTTNRSSNLSRLGPPAPIDIKRHADQCAICKSEDRQEIENLFLHWMSPGYIVEQFRVRSRMTLYRHMHATGLYEYRRRNLRSALDHLIENAASTAVSGDCVIRAIRAQSRLSEDGRWSEPVQRVIVSRRPANFASSEDEPQDVLQREILVDTPTHAQIPVTSTKQTPELVSGRDKIDPSSEPT
jgi:hypothetical protein